MDNFLKNEYKSFIKLLVGTNKKVFVIFVSVAILQTISWYLTSRNFFRENFYYNYFNGNTSADLYEFLYWFLSDTFTLLILPLLIIKFVLNEKISSYGLKTGDFKTGIKFLIIFSIPVVVITFILSGLPEFAQAYPFLKAAKYDLKTFILFEISALVYMFAWEFIWRGFMLFGLEEKFGINAILIQMLPFVILHNGKPFIETISAILGAMILGYIAFRTRSFYYGAAIHFIMFFSMDLFVVLKNY